MASAKEMAIIIGAVMLLSLCLTIFIILAQGELEEAILNFDDSQYGRPAYINIIYITIGALIGFGLFSAFRLSLTHFAEAAPFLDTVWSRALIMLATTGAYYFFSVRPRMLYNDAYMTPLPATPVLLIGMVILYEVAYDIFIERKIKKYRKARH